jgi:hypothetical protein
MRIDDRRHYRATGCEPRKGEKILIANPRTFERF